MGMRVLISPQIGLGPRQQDCKLDPAPELVVEIVSGSDTIGVLSAKLSDYQHVGVQECWIAQPSERTVDLLALSPEGIESIGVYQEPVGIVSQAFPSLRLEVADIFAD